MPIWIIIFYQRLVKVLDCGYWDEALLDVCMIARYSSRILCLVYTAIGASSMLWSLVCQLQSFLELEDLLPYTQTTHALGETVELLCTLLALHRVY